MYGKSVDDITTMFLSLKILPIFFHCTYLRLFCILVGCSVLKKSLKNITSGLLSYINLLRLATDNRKYTFYEMNGFTKESYPVVILRHTSVCRNCLISLSMFMMKFRETINLAFHNFSNVFEVKESCD